jgi:hypothetical protein
MMSTLTRIGLALVAAAVAMGAASSIAYTGEPSSPDDKIWVASDGVATPDNREW